MRSAAFLALPQWIDRFHKNMTDLYHIPSKVGVCTAHQENELPVPRYEEVRLTQAGLDRSQAERAQLETVKEFGLKAKARIWA